MNRKPMVRPILKTELPALLDLYERHLFDTPDDPLPESETVSAIWNSLMDNPSTHIFVVEWEDRIVSSATLTIIPNLTRGCRPYGVIENVVTRDECRGRGMASMLLRETLCFAWQNRCYKVMLLSATHRKIAHDLYEKVGFSHTEKMGFVAHPQPIVLE